MVYLNEEQRKGFDNYKVNQIDPVKHFRYVFIALFILLRSIMFRILRISCSYLSKK